MTILQRSLSAAVKGIKQLRKKDTTLRKENQELKAKLATAEQNTRPQRSKKDDPTVSELQRRVKSLEAEMKVLKKVGQSSGSILEM